MQFGYTILYVADVRQSLDFYQRAFGLETSYLHESGDFGQLETGSTILAFSSRSLMESLGKIPLAPQPEAPSFEIALVTDDVPQAVARATEAGARLMSPPELMPWGQTVAYVADPDGFLVELCTLVKV